MLITVWKTKEKAIYVSITELARMLGISRVVVFKKIKKGKFLLIKSATLSPFQWSTSKHTWRNRFRYLNRRKKDVIRKAVEKVVKEWQNTPPSW